MSSIEWFAGNTSSKTGMQMHSFWSTQKLAGRLRLNLAGWKCWSWHGESFHDTLVLHKIPLLTRYTTCRCFKLDIQVLKHENFNGSCLTCCVSVCDCVTPWTQRSRELWSPQAGARAPEQRSDSTPAAGQAWIMSSSYFWPLFSWFLSSLTLKIETPFYHSIAIHFLD